MFSPQLPNTVQHLCFTAVFSWQLLLTVHCYLTVYQSAWQPGQHRLVWEKTKTWWLLVFLEVFWTCLVLTLFCVMKKPNWTWPYLLCKQYLPPCLICAMFIHNKHEDTEQFGAHNSSHVPVWCPGHLSNSPSLPGTNRNFSSLLLHYVFLFSFPPFLPCPPFAPFLPEKPVE